jgi:hypothetical protein
LESGVTLPDHVVVDAESVSMGDRAQELEGTRIAVLNVEVTALNIPAGPGDMDPTQEFQVNGSLAVNDLFHLIEPAPQVGEQIDRLQGILIFVNGAFKIEPNGP